MDTRLNEFFTSVIQTLRSSTDRLLLEFPHVIMQDLSHFAVPLGLAAAFISVLSAVFVAHKWKRTTNTNSEKLQQPEEDYSTVGREINGNHTVKTDPTQGRQIYAQPLNLVLAVKRIHRLEKQMEEINVYKINTWLSENDPLRAKMKKEVAKREMMNADPIQGRWLSSHSLQLYLALKRIQTLEKQIEEINVYKINTWLSENDPLRAKMRRLAAQMQYHQPNDEVLLELKIEQQKREEAEKSLQEHKAELENKNQKLKTLSREVETFHLEITRTKESQEKLEQELQNYISQNTIREPEHTPGAEEVKPGNKTPENTDPHQQLQDLQVNIEALDEKNKKLEAQLAELKNRFKQEFKALTTMERQWRAELEKDTEILREELEKTNNEFGKIQKEEEPKTLEEELSVKEEEEQISETTQ